MRHAVLVLIGLLTPFGWGSAAPAEAAATAPNTAQAATQSPSQEAGARGHMTPERLADLLRREKLSPEGAWPQIVFYVANTRVFAIVDEANDRMRFAVPLSNTTELETGRYRELLKANYHATGDVRFAVNRDVLWLVYVHRLSTLTETDAISAINQLAHHATRLTHP